MTPASAPPRADGGSDAAADAPPPPVDVAPVDVAPPPVDVAPVDVPPPPPPPPPPPAGLPIGTACERDDQCASRVCARGAGLTAACAQPCRSDADCAPTMTSCALDRAAAGPRWVCANVEGSVSAGGEVCGIDAECLSNLCADRRCRNACADDAACAAGWRCTTVAGAGAGTACGFAPIGGVAVDTYTLYEGDSSFDLTTSTYPLLVPPDAVSVTWLTQDLGGRDLFAAVTSVRSPADAALVDLRTWSPLREQPIRTLTLRPQYNSATLPSRDGVTVAPGLYTSSHILFNDRGAAVTDGRRIRAQAIVKRAPGAALSTGWTLRFALFFVGVPGVNATTAPTNARVQAAINGMRRIYAAANVNVQVTGYVDVGATEAARLSVIDSQAELRDLFALTSGTPTLNINLFFVRGISASAGLENAIGVAGGINGPPGIPSTVQSGVAVSWNTVAGGVDLLPQVMAHECGHYLGLWHLQESQPACTASGQMNCSIFGGVDAITDTPTGAAASRYLMNWQTSNGSNVTISPGQSYVMRVNPLVR